MVAIASKIAVSGGSSKAWQKRRKENQNGHPLVSIMKTIDFRTQRTVGKFFSLDCSNAARK